MRYPTWLLAVLLVGVVGGGILFMLGVGGTLAPRKATLDPEYVAATSTATKADGEFLEQLDAEKYNQLIEEKKSFVLFLDQGGCQVADRLRGFITQYAEEEGILPLRMMFAERGETNLKGVVKYYPSVVVVSQGRVVDFLDNGADEDTEEFNDYAAFKNWLEGLIS